MVYNQNINLDLDTRAPSVIIGAKQYDNNSRTITATILENGKALNIPSNALASYRIQKPNGRVSWKNAPIDYAKSAVKIILRAEDLSVSGRNIVDVVLTIGSFTLGTTNFILDIQPAPDIHTVEQDSESLSHLEELVQQANFIIEGAQAWAVGRRGDEAVVTDSYTIGAPEGLNVTLDFETFKSQITPKTAGATITYIFTYTTDGWIYSYNNSIVDMSSLGITIIPVDDNNPVLGDVINITAAYTDEAYQNNAKYYSEITASIATSVQSNLNSFTENLNNKLDIPLAQSVAPTNPKVGDFWVDSNAEFVLKGEVVDSSNIKPGVVLASHISQGAIHAIHIAEGAIVTSAISSGAITNAVLDIGAVDSMNILSGAVQSWHIANGAITSLGIESGAIQAEHLSNNIVSSENLVTGAVYSDNIADGAIQNRHLALGILGGDQLLDGSITKKKFDFIKTGFVQGSSTTPYPYIRVAQAGPDAVRGFVLVSGRRSAGLVAYNIYNSSTDGTTFIGYRSSSGTVDGITLPATNLGLALGSQGINIQNKGTAAAAFMVINLMGQITVTVSSGAIA